MLRQAPSNEKVIAFAWSGLPDYGARLIRAACDGPAQGATVHVIATRPKVPIEGMEASLGRRIHWVAADDRTTSWDTLGLAPPSLMFQAGYGIKPFNDLGQDCRSQGGRVILMTDENWRGDLRQRLINPLRHRLFLRHRFDGIFVPGKSGRRHAQTMGYSAGICRMGLYGADPELFQGGAPLDQRPKDLVFVGQLIDRKCILPLCRAFLLARDTFPEWRLRICGDGPLSDQIPDHPALLREKFVQPAQLGKILQEARCLVLPSKLEHWGLVVHEATLAGCALALSDAVGAGQDLAGPQNSVTFAGDDVAALQSKLEYIMGWSGPEWQNAEAQSRDRASQFGPSRFAESVAFFMANE